MNMYVLVSKILREFSNVSASIGASYESLPRRVSKKVEKKKNVYKKNSSRAKFLD